MGNKARINDKDIVEIVMEGEIKYYKLVNFFISVGALSNALDFSGKDILLLVDLTTAVNIESLAKRLITTMFSISIFDRLAVVGGNEQIRKDMNEIAIASNRVKKMKAFDTKEEAETWLLSK